MTKLGRRQKAILEYLIRWDGYNPTYEDIRHKIGLKSKSGVAEHMRNLCEKGFIYREKWSSEYVILKDPDGKQIRPPIDPLKDQVKKVCKKLLLAEEQLRSLL